MSAEDIDDGPSGNLFIPLSLLIAVHLSSGRIDRNPRLHRVGIWVRDRGVRFQGYGEHRDVQSRCRQYHPPLSLSQGRGESRVICVLSPSILKEVLESCLARRHHVCKSCWVVLRAWAQVPFRRRVTRQSEISALRLTGEKREARCDSWALFEYAGEITTLELDPHRTVHVATRSAGLGTNVTTFRVRDDWRW